MGARVDDALLEQKLTQLEEARDWSPRLVSKLETTIRTAGDYDLLRINPLRYAREKGMSEREAIDLFLHATKVGLFEMEWFMVCASCGHVVESLRELGSLHAEFVCNVCSSQHEASLDDYIQVAFTVSPQIREIAFHHPETLSARDLYLKHQLAKGVLTPPGAPPFAEYCLVFTQLLADLDPHETRSIEFELPPGELHLTDIRNNAMVVLSASAERASALQHLPVRLSRGAIQVGEHALEPREQHLGTFVYRYDRHADIASGPVRVEIANLGAERSSLWVFNRPQDVVPVPLQFEPFLSGKRLLSTQTFRNLFRSAAGESGEGIRVKDATYLFTDLKGSTALYEQIGDAKAFYLVHRHFGTLMGAVERHGGAVVKTIGDAVMATFLSPVDAVRAALDMLRDIEEFNRGISEQLVLKVGIHRGHSIVVSVNDRHDYFGQNVNIASRIQGLADANEIYVSADVYREPDVQAALAGAQVEALRPAIKGVSESMLVYKVTAGAQ